MERISPPTRRAFREHLVGWSVLRQIEEYFEVEGFHARDIDLSVSGARRSLVEQFYADVDWTSSAATRRVIRVFEAILRDLNTSTGSSAETVEKEMGKLGAFLNHDGYTWDENTGRIVSARPLRLAELDDEQLCDPEVIHDHLRRLGNEIDTDPAAAIATAKELVESTCKLTLNELGIAYEPDATVGQLVRATTKALGLHPQVVGPDQAGAETVRRILGALGVIASGLAELRNVYGRGHGRDRIVKLQPRHAYLAVGAADTFCRTVLATLADPAAPWADRKPA